jgi:hypothetical protein
MIIFRVRGQRYQVPVHRLRAALAEATKKAR